MKALLISLAALTTLVTVPAVAAGSKAANVALAPLSSLPEVRQYVQTSRNLDAAVTSGINSRDYSRLVVELTAATSALDEVLEPTGQVELRAQLAEVLRLHQRVKEFWGACIGDSAVRHSLVNMSVPNSVAVVYATSLLRDFPQLNKSVEEGGVLTRISGYPQSYVYQDAALSALWQLAEDAAKPLRQKLR